MEASIIITNRPQTCPIGILTNHRWERPVVLNLGHLDFEIVSDFDIRISDFRLSAPYPSIPSCFRAFLPNVRALQLSSALYKSPLFMQNKPNVKIGKMTISTVATKPYPNEQRTINNEHYSKQTQTNPKLSPPTQYAIRDTQYAIRHPKYDIRIHPPPRRGSPAWNLTQTLTAGQLSQML
jgi:hypothetical protein